MLTDCTCEQIAHVLRVTKQPAGDDVGSLTVVLVTLTVLMPRNSAAPSKQDSAEETTDEAEHVSEDALKPWIMSLVSVPSP
jgi:hypothetical protein